MDDEHDDDPTEDNEIYDIFFVEGVVPANDAKAIEKIKDEITQGMQSIPKEELREERLRLFAGFFYQFPELFPPRTKSGRKKPPEGLMLTSWSKSLSLLCCPMDLAEELVPFGLGLAKELELTVFDGITGNLHRPYGYDGIEMIVEDKPNFIAPTLVQISDAVSSLTPDGGPSVLIIDRTGDCFAQIAGGDNKFTCEWRDFHPDSFQHWVAGRQSKQGKLVRIPTNGYYVEIYENECLSGDDVIEILQDCAEGRNRSDKWTWRETTDDYDS